MQQLSVSSLLRYLKNRLDSDENLQKIYVAGEISNYHRHFSGHLYFTLKDEKASVSCVMFKSAASFLNFEPKTGDKVVVYANTSIYEPGGQLQLYVLKMTPEGYGDLYARYEALKNKLTQEGKFDDTHKITLSTEYPERIAVLVGDKSAAMSDIKTAFARRWPLCQVDYYPVLVQGTGAPEDICGALKKVDPMGYDAIILARGGGSFEDLFCFNDETLVNTIYDLNTFIITGIGHEQDFTLADFAADLRAATPTAAVGLITPHIEDVIDLVTDYESELYSLITSILDNRRMKYDYLLSDMLRFKERFTNISTRIDHQSELIRNSILHRINVYTQRTDYDLSQIRTRLDFRLSETQLLYKRLFTLLNAYSSENVLKRGFSLVFQDGKIVKRKKMLKNEEFEIRFQDGSIQAIERDQHGK
ncbi:MAG: exodeoxyribonuclease VII large subunit [Erysipelotrichaceae bacterium]|nr:exodeoxyribonuclease VII large subunit [Erysipelotrichaceae bacterium]